MSVKTPEQVLIELEKIADQSRRDADLVKQYIDLQKRLNLNGHSGTSDLITSASEGLKKAKRGRPSMEGGMKQAVIDFLKSKGTFVQSSEIRAELERLFPTKTSDQIYQRVRDILSKESKEIVKKPNPNARGLLYGLKTLESK